MTSTSQSSFFVLCAIVIFILANTSHCAKYKWWLVDSNRTYETLMQSMNAFESIQVPEYSSTTMEVPRTGHYGLFNFAPDSPISDPCDNTTFSQTFHTSCETYFCSGDSERNIVSLQEDQERIMFARYINYCAYCATCGSNFIERLHSGQCGLFYEMFVVSSVDQCKPKWLLGDLRNSTKLNYPVVTHYLLPQTSSVSLGELSDYFTDVRSPFVCFCVKSGLFGYECDAYTHIAIPMFLYALPVINWLYTIVLFILMAVTLVIPRVIERIREWRSLENKCAVKAFLLPFDIRVQALFFLEFGLIIMSVEQIIRFMYNFYFTRGFRVSLMNGLPRMVSFLLLGYTNAAILMLWCHVTSSEISSETLSVSHKVVLGLFYLGLASIIPVCLGVNSFTNQDEMFATFTLLILLFYMVFAIGFTIYGIKMYRKLISMHSNVSLVTLKFSRFIIFSNVFLLGGFVLVGAVVPSYVIGSWDMTGLFIGLAKSEFMDLLGLSMMTLLGYMLYNKKCYESAFITSSSGYQIASDSHSSDTNTDN